MNNITFKIGNTNMECCCVCLIFHRYNVLRTNAISIRFLVWRAIKIFAISFPFLFVWALCVKCENRIWQESALHLILMKHGCNEIIFFRFNLIFISETKCFHLPFFLIHILSIVFCFVAHINSHLWNFLTLFFSCFDFMFSKSCSNNYVNFLGTC